MTVFEIIEQIAKTASRNEKQSILKSHIDNKLLQRVIKLTYDPTNIYYIKKIPEYCPDNSDLEPFTLDWALDQLEKLSSRELTGHAGVAHLKEILENVDPKDAIIIERVIGKDIRAGFSEGTANKVWPKLVPEWPCMLCHPFDEKLIAKIQWPAVVQLKMDSMRCEIVVTDDIVEFRSRNGRILEIDGPIRTELLIMAHKENFAKNLKGNNIVYDGEIWVCDENDSTKLAPREIGNGILLKAQKGTLSNMENDRIRITLWDRIEYNDFFNGISKVQYGYRWNVLVDDYKHLTKNFLSNYIFLVEQHAVNNIEDAQEVFGNYLKDKLEGIILKDLTSIWEDKRSRKQIKFKAELDCDLICTAWHFGKKGSENEFRLGKATFESLDGLISFNVGTGFSDKQRDELTEENMVGTIWKIMYNTRIKNKNKPGKEALFLGRVIEQRWDKTEPDHSKDIK